MMDSSSGWSPGGNQTGNHGETHRPWTPGEEAVAVTYCGRPVVPVDLDRYPRRGWTAIPPGRALRPPPCALVGGRGPGGPRLNLERGTPTRGAERRACSASTL